MPCLDDMNNSVCCPSLHSHTHATKVLACPVVVHVILTEALPGIIDVTYADVQ